MLTASAAKDFLLSNMSSFLSLDHADPQNSPTSREKIGNKIFLTCDGMTKSLKEWAFYVGINRNTLYSRLRRGWSIEKALYTPVKKNDLETARIFLEALADAYSTQ